MFSFLDEMGIADDAAGEQYLFVYVYDMPPAGETGGLFFP